MNKLKIQHQNVVHWAVMCFKWPYATGLNLDTAVQISFVVKSSKMFSNIIPLVIQFLLRKNSYFGVGLELNLCEVREIVVYTRLHTFRSLVAFKQSKFNFPSSVHVCRMWSRYFKGSFFFQMFRFAITGAELRPYSLYQAPVPNDEHKNLYYLFSIVTF